MERAELISRFRDGPLLLDGATGTELESRGVRAVLPLWSAGALRTHPHVVEAIHADYVAAGADIVVANTFRTNPRSLRAAGLMDAGPALNAQAVALVRSVARAVGREVIVAASVAPVEDCYMPERVPDERTLGAEHGLMMQWLSAAAPDLVWIETMGTVREGRAAAVAAAEARLPHVVSFLPAESGSLLGGESLEDALAAVIGTGPLAVGVNCAPPSGVTAVLPRLRDSTALPLVAYAHINNVHPLRGWSYAERCSPDEYAAHAVAWLAAGAAVVGGCCGTTPAHVAAVRSWLDRM